MQEPDKQAYHRETWLSDDQLKALPYNEYWNDTKKEKKKFWDISDGNFKKLEEGLEKSGLLNQLQDACKQLASMNRALEGKGASLGCGTCWLEAELIKTDNSITHIDCIEFSRHRIFHLAPKVLAHYNVPPERIKLCLGSFYELKIESNTLDFVILCQAFYMADYPDRLLE